MSRKHLLLKGAFILTLTGFATRFMGFFFRIFLSHTFGEEGVGLYQLIFPVYALCFSLTCSGIQTALSRCVAGRIASGREEEARELLRAAILLTLTASCFCALFLQRFSGWIAQTFLPGAPLLPVPCDPLLRFPLRRSPQLHRGILSGAQVHPCPCRLPADRTGGADPVRFPVLPDRNEDWRSLRDLRRCGGPGHGGDRFLCLQPADAPFQGTFLSPEEAPLLPSPRQMESAPGTGILLPPSYCQPGLT